MSARTDILARLRLADVAGPEAPPELPAYRRRTGMDVGARCALFAERVADYRATVHRVRSDALAETIADVLARQGIRRVAVPADLPAGWLAAAAVERTVDDPPPTPAQLDRLDGAVTGAALAIAETGTIVLDAGAAQGRRLLTLVPDFHLCVVGADQVVGGVPEGMQWLGGSARAGRPITLISGPSATSDIELDRVEGVHGPRTLHVVLFG
ncbi:MAG: LutC/YkgG family protein [Mycobacteriales bacterium]